MPQGIKHSQKHDEKYWDRLRKQFSSGQYANTGAYGDKVRPKPTRNFLEKETTNE